MRLCGSCSNPTPLKRVFNVLQISSGERVRLHRSRRLAIIFAAAVGRGHEEGFFRRMTGRKPCGVEVDVQRWPIGFSSRKRVCVRVYVSV